MSFIRSPTSKTDVQFQIQNVKIYNQFQAEAKAKTLPIGVAPTTEYNSREGVPNSPSPPPLPGSNPWKMKNIHLARNVTN